MPLTLVLFVVLVVILAWEWTNLTLGAFVAPCCGLLVLGSLAAVLMASQGLWYWSLLPILAAGLGAGALAPADLEVGGRYTWMLAGSVYIGLPSLAFLWLRELHPQGLDWTLWLLAIVWAVDTFAYVVGSQVGGAKLWPQLSPRKTWSGFLGGTAAGVSAGLLGGLWVSGQPLWLLALLAGLLALVAQAGDLAESALKRRVGVKDASALIPGHGGLMDRVDGLLPASIVLAVALWLLR